MLRDKRFSTLRPMPLLSYLTIFAASTSSSTGANVVICYHSGALPSIDAIRSMLMTSACQ